ncbi:hypothetical protein LCGC14_1402110 [marine sediment metagenome]|uniref:Uncharacterized protein n=1 Tax=marine sediment metagenome TaxID=412755 RepID=A0A0F9JX48_9ZZZZ
MGWYTVMGYLEDIDQRKLGAIAGLRRYLRGETDPPRTLRVATLKFIEHYGRSPRYLPSPWHSPSTANPLTQQPTVAAPFDDPKLWAQGDATGKSRATVGG